MLLFSDYTSMGYNSLLSEELNDEQKATVDSWIKDRKGPSKAEEISGHVIPAGQDRITIPLENTKGEKEVQAHPDVKKHLEDNGYEISDYKGGYAKDKHGRTVSIGKALNKTNASVDVKKAFENDPQRKGSTQAAKGLNIIISRHPHDVAGMSTNQGWTSCMNMKGGCNAHYLKHDVDEGTHVAYLVHHDDPEGKKPLARIALKPFKSDDGHTILRPESAAYGDSDSSFSRTVSNWADKNFPMKPKTIYKKNSKVYHDSGARMIGGDKDAFLNDSNPRVRASAFTRTASEITTEDVDRGMKDVDPKVRAAAIKHKLSTREHLDKALNDEKSSVRLAALRHKDITTKDLENHFDRKKTSESELSTILGHKKVTDDIVRKALESKSEKMKALAFRSARFSKDVTDEYVNKAVDGKIDVPYYHQFLVNNNPNITKDHLHKILLGGNPNTKGNLQDAAASALSYNKNIDTKSKFEIANKLFDKDYKPANKNNHPAMVYLRANGEVNNEILDKAINHSDPQVRSFGLRRLQAIQHNKMSFTGDARNDPSYKSSGDEVDLSKFDHKKIIDDAVNDESSNVRSVAAESPNLTKEHIDKLANDKDRDVVYQLLNSDEYGRSNSEKGKYINPLLTKKHLDTILQNHGSDRILMKYLVKHPNATKEHISKLLDSPDEQIRYETIKSDKVNKEHIDKALNDQYKGVRVIALRQPKVEPSHLRKAMLDPEPMVRRTAAEHHKLEPDLIEKAINDGDSEVRSGVAGNPALSHEQLHTMLKDKNSTVRFNAIQNLQMTPEHFKVALKDADSTLRSYANSVKENLQNHRNRFIEQHPEAKHIIKRFQ